MILDICLESGKVIGIGKLKIFITDNFPHEIPTLSFLVAKNKDGKFISTCIQLLVDGEGETPDSSIKDLENKILDYLEIVFSDDNKKNSWDILHNAFNDDFASDYWKAYRNFQLNLAEKGISTNSKSALYKLITKLKKQISDLEEVTNKTEYGIELKVVDYQESAE